MSDLLDDEFDDLAAAEIPTGRPAQPGDTITVAMSGVTINTGQFSMGGGVVLTRGNHFILTSEMVDASRDRNGEPTWTALIHDERAQVEKYGEVRFLLGRHEIERWADSHDTFWQVDHDQARANALSIVDPTERAAALVAVRERFGQKPEARVAVLHGVPRSPRRRCRRRRRSASSGAPW